MGTLGVALRKSGNVIGLYTGDSDMRQLVGDGVYVVVPGGSKANDKLYGPAEVFEKHGVTPAQIPDLKALAGDDSDGIPGLAGIGGVTAAKLVSAYGTAEKVVKAAQGGMPLPVPERHRALLASSEAAVALYKWLATIRLDVRLHSIAPAPDRANMLAEFRRLDFQSLMTPLQLLALGRLAGRDV
jgi:DNA polymerase-1